jgi:plastocyanin
MTLEHTVMRRDVRLRTRRVFLAGLCCLALVGAGCADGTSSKEAASGAAAAPGARPNPPAAGPQSYTVAVDGPSTLGAENYVFGAYFPKTLAVRPGDTVVFENRSSNDLHTVTFGVKGDRSDVPAEATPAGQLNPVVFAPCVAAAPRADLDACAGAQPPARPGGTAPPLPPYTGKGYWNSGALLHTAAPPEAGPKSVTVRIAADIAPGSYPYICILHRFMAGTIEVVASDADRATPAAATSAGDAEWARAKSAAAALTEPKPVAGPTGASVAASWGDQMIAVNRFAPQTVTIKAGQTVTWKSDSSWMAHTVSFQPPFKTPAERNALLPAGARSGSRYAGGVAHSGIFGPPPEFPADSFSLTFTKPGTYPYTCLLHPGMAGTVQVV